MDPITRASHAFLAEADAFWRAAHGPVMPMIAGHSERSDLVKTLRLKELSPENRRPMFLYEGPFDEPRAYFDGLAESVRDDYEQIRKGAAEEGVILPPFREPSSNGDNGAPLERAVLAVERAAALLADRLDGVLAALVPARVLDEPAWRDSIAALARTRPSPRVRWAVFNPPGGPLNQVFGSAGAHFHVDPNELIAFLKQIGKGGSAGPQTQAPPAPTEAQKRAFEAATGRKLPAPETAVAFRGLLLDATQCTAAGKHAEAAALYRDARVRCQQEALVLEEAMLLIALGGACLGAGRAEAAAESYRQAAQLAQTKGAWPVVCQAWLGVGGALLTTKHYEASAIAYRQSADAAKRADIMLLQVEALRMAGTALLLRGMTEKAVDAWQDAVHAGATLDAPTRSASTFPQVAAALMNLLTRLGLYPQADYVRSVLQAQEEQPDAGSESSPVSVAAADNSEEISTTGAVSNLPSLTGTSDMTGAVPAGPVLPFVPAAQLAEPPPAPRPPVAAGPVPELPPWAGATTGLPFGPNEPRRVLPFFDQSPAEESPRAELVLVGTPAGPDPELPSWAKELPSWAGETLGLAFGLSAPRSVLPFGEKSSSPQSAEPLQGSPSWGSHVGAAVEVIHGLNLQQHASLSAELAVFPERSSIILSRYGVPDEETRKRVSEAWAQRLAKNPALRQTWMDVFAHYWECSFRQRSE